MEQECKSSYYPYYSSPWARPYPCKGKQASRQAEQLALHPNLVHCGGLCVQDVCWGCSQGQHPLGREQKGSGLSRLRGMALWLVPNGAWPSRAALAVSQAALSSPQPPGQCDLQSQWPLSLKTCVPVLRRRHGLSSLLTGRASGTPDVQARNWGDLHCWSQGPTSQGCPLLSLCLPIVHSPCPPRSPSYWGQIIFLVCFRVCPSPSALLGASLPPLLVVLGLGCSGAYTFFPFVTVIHCYHLVPSSANEHSYWAAPAL